jgi:hypothetical protein
MPFPVGGFSTRAGAARIRGDKIVWEKLSEEELRRDPRGLPVPYGLRGFRLLENFLALSNGKTDSVLKFAERYGPLRGLKPMGGEREYLKDWERCSTWARATLTVANKLQEGKPLREQDWAMLGGNPPLGPSTPRPPRELIRSMERSALIATVNSILLLWDVRPSVNWEHGAEVSLRLGGRTLLSGIGALLLSAICRSDRPVLCSGCGNAYFPRRKPREGENHFCAACGRKTARKLAQRKYMEKLRSQKEGEQR